MEHLPDFGDGDRVKVCEGCDERVHNLSALSPDQAVELIEHNDGICVRFEVGSQGRPKFRPRSPASVLRPSLVGGLTMALSVAASCGENTETSVTGSPSETTETSTDTKTQPVAGRIGRRDHEASKKAGAAEPNEADCEDEPTPQ